MPDPRVTHFWDEDRLVGSWYGELELLGCFRCVRWDIYYLYGPNAAWNDHLLYQLLDQDPWLDSGVTIFGSRNRLQANVIPLLEE